MKYLNKNLKNTDLATNLKHLFSLLKNYGSCQWNEHETSMISYRTQVIVISVCSSFP